MRWLGPLTISIAPVPYHPSTGSRSPLSLIPRPPWPCHIKRLVPLATAEVVTSLSTAACRPLARPRPATSPLLPRRRRRLPPPKLSHHLQQKCLTAPSTSSPPWPFSLLIHRPVSSSRPYLVPARRRTHLLRVSPLFRALVCIDHRSCPLPLVSIAPLSRTHLSPSDSPSPSRRTRLSYLTSADRQPSTNHHNRPRTLDIPSTKLCSWRIMFL